LQSPMVGVPPLPALGADELLDPQAARAAVRARALVRPSVRLSCM
jgi:hypothetical protein